MGDSTRLLHGFSYASAIPNEYKQGNPIHVLGESISFGRFTSESLSWEKWSTFPHKKYVEEAERYAQPGSVAQKKAFFEAHYKRIAALKAAALLDQQNAAAAAAIVAQNEAVSAVDDDISYNNNDDNNDSCEEERVLLNSNIEVDCKNEDEEQILVNINEPNGKEEEEISVITEKGVSDDSPMKRNCENRDEISVSEASESTPMERPLVKVTSLGFFYPNDKKEEISVISENGVSTNSPMKRNRENQDEISVSEASESTQMERPLLKQNCVDSEEVTSKPRLSPSSLKASILHKTWRVSSTKQESPHFNKAMQSSRKSNFERLHDKRPSSPKSLRELLNLVHNKEPDKPPLFPSQSVSRPHKDCSTPLKTPAQASSKAHPAATPRTENRRMKTPIDSSATGRKTSAPKWHILSAVPKSLSAYRNKLLSPTVSTPFTLRTEERAARRKQKLEEKFNSSESPKMQTQKTLKEKAGNEFRKLSCSLCFKAQASPDFYTETPNNHMKKNPEAQQQTTVLGRSISNKKQGTVSMPPPPAPPANKNSSQKNVLNQTKHLNRSLQERIEQHENASPNIQQ